MSDAPRSPSTRKPRWTPSSVDLSVLSAAPSEDHFQLHLASIEFELSAPITIETKEDILSRKHWSVDLKPYEHQVNNLITFCRRAPVALFADDVGLGKTISAGLVLNELQTRKKVRRALVLCPKMLLNQWREELAEKFGIHAATGVGQDLNVWLRQTVPVVITTYESARDRMDAIRAASIDMLILDEAHKLRNLHGTASAPQIATALHQALANRSFLYVLMLTATPIQNRLWDLYSLLDCLAAAKGHTNPLGTPPEFEQRYLADGAASARRLRPATREEFRRKAQEYMVRTSRGEARLAFPTRQILPVQCHASPAEKRLQQIVGTSVRGLNALARTSLAEALMSSPRALLAQVENMTRTGTLPPSVLAQLKSGVDAAGPGCKLAKLLEILAALQSQNPQNWRALVFTRRTDTLNLIREALERHRIPTASVQGNGGSSNQAAIRKFHLNPPGANVLVSTDAGAVGLNLQICNVVINYDLPWNPMVLEQRIGRVQRLGSTFKHVEVLNFTIGNSIEDIIVARLLEKLQAIAATIGDIEAILEASSYGDDEQFEEEVKQLVARALMGHDVNAAVRKAEESIRRAREVYDSQREQVETTLGSLDAMHRAGPAVPKLKARAPRFDVAKFCRLAFACDGARVVDLPNGQIRVAPKGRAPWTATFDENDPDLLRTGTSTFGGSTVLLYQEGSRFFEGLLGEWRRVHLHRVVDRVQESRGLIDQLLSGWVESLGVGLRLLRSSIRQERVHFQGNAHVRATASVSHDRYEKMCSAEFERSDHGPLPPLSGDEILSSKLTLTELLPQARQAVIEAVERDPDIQEFARFYDARREEESERAGANAFRREEIERRFETALAAQLVAASGTRYASFEVTAYCGAPNGDTPYEAALHVLPLHGRILAEPERALCAATGAFVPRVWLGQCEISRRLVLRHLLERSPISNVVAQSHLFGTCEVSKRRVLLAELHRSELSGKLIAVDLLQRSAVSGKFAQAEELVLCEFTGARVLPQELVRSAASGRMVRCDEIQTSAVSGAPAHRSELRACEETGSMILPTEGASSDVSGRFVRQDLLVSSEKHPTRRGLQSETVVCTITGKRLLRDEAERSFVSGTWIDKDLAVRSGVSRHPARPDEIVRCAATGIALLPNEARSSAASGRVVDLRLLVPSALSGKLALPDELRSCSYSKDSILPAEGEISEVSGAFVRSDQIVTSAVSKLRGHRAEFIRCAVSKVWLLPTEAGTSSVSGAKVNPNLLRCSEKPPGRQGLETEFRVCSVSGRRLLRDEVAKSDATGNLVDLDLLVRSDRSGRLATEDEMVICEVSGSRLLPDETAVCAITGKRVDRQLLVKSEISDRLGLRTQTARCEFTGATGLVDELVKSDVSGKLCRKDQLQASALSGFHGHRSELVNCALSGQSLLPSEAAPSSVSGRLARRDLLVQSEKNPDRLGFPEEAMVCSISGKRLLQDELSKSDLSGRMVDRELATRSTASGRIGLPSEILTCEESGVTLLPDETEVCSITGKRVDRRITAASDISGKRGLARLLQVCPETGRKGFQNEFVSCAVSGLLVDPSQVGTCSFTGETVLSRLLVRCACTERWLRRDKAMGSEKSGRLGHPDCTFKCTWTGRHLLTDEARRCSLTGLPFDADLVTEGAPANPLLELMAAGVPGGVPEEPIAAKLKLCMAAVSVKPRAMSLSVSKSGFVLAYLVDCSTLFGLKKRHAVGFARLENEGVVLLHQPRFGRLEANSTWLPESTHGA